MTKEEKLRKEDEKLDRELIEVLTKISVVASRMARNIEKYSQQKDVSAINDSHSHIVN